MDFLEEDLTCSVCYSLFCDPRMLPCSHTFCKSCLDSVLHASASKRRRLRLKCPKCRSAVELAPSGVDGLPTNRVLRAIVEKYHRSCKARPQSCQEHPRQPLNMYCVQDRQLICGLCLTVGRHQGHAIGNLQAVFDRERQTPALLLAGLLESRWSQVFELGQQLKKEKRCCEDLLRWDRQQVSQYFETLEVVLAKKKRAFLDALDKAAAEVSQAFDPLIDRVKELQEEQLELVSVGSSVEKEKSPLAFLEKVHLFREQVEEFTSSPLPSPIKLSVSPRAADFLQLHWPSVTIGGLDEAPVPDRLVCSANCGTTGPDSDAVTAIEVGAVAAAAAAAAKLPRRRALGMWCH
ncbi:tripartite motif-containing protein 59-like [Nelusetta ayraudi]|uniref:tripartite motif-containing protein 59-like n=1 Tax=Nelusetta ayraudi TaxID=303726 RepID=UPI003F71F6CA